MVSGLCTEKKDNYRFRQNSMEIQGASRFLTVVD